jgi:hypothetical protein
VFYVLRHNHTAHSRSVHQLDYCQTLMAKQNTTARMTSPLGSQRLVTASLSAHQCSAVPHWQANALQCSAVPVLQAQKAPRAATCWEQYGLSAHCSVLHSTTAKTSHSPDSNKHHVTLLDAASSCWTSKLTPSTILETSFVHAAHYSVPILPHIHSPAFPQPNGFHVRLPYIRPRALLLAG